MLNTHFTVIGICLDLIQSIAAGGRLLTISTLLPKAGSQLPIIRQDSYLIHLRKSKPTALYCWIYGCMQYIVKWDTLEDYIFILLHTMTLGRKKKKDQHILVNQSILTKATTCNFQMKLRHSLVLTTSLTWQRDLRIKVTTRIWDHSYKNSIILLDGLFKRQKKPRSGWSAVTMQRELKRGESLLNHDHTSQTGAASRRGPHSGGYSWRGPLKGSHFYPGAEQIPHNSCQRSRLPQRRHCHRRRITPSLFIGWRFSCYYSACIRQSQKRGISFVHRQTGSLVQRTFQHSSKAKIIQLCWNAMLRGGGLGRGDILSHNIEQMK